MDEIELGHFKSFFCVLSGKISKDGFLLEANEGLLSLLRLHGEKNPRITNSFIVPSWNEISKMRPNKEGMLYQGKLDLESMNLIKGITGEIWVDKKNNFYLIAEYDLARLESLQKELIIACQKISAERQHFIDEIDQLKIKEEKLLLLSMTDPLTGAGNRRQLKKTLHVEFSRAARIGGEFCIVMCDIDHFKKINEHFSHLVGDEVLKELVKFLSKQIRATDTLCRYGGEEFTIIMPTTNIDTAKSAIERIRYNISKEIFPPLDKPITLSFGVASLRHGEDEYKLLERAEKALQLAKKTGRNKVVTQTDLNNHL